MQQKDHLFGLLSGFLSGMLTPEEKRDLYRYIIDDRHKAEIVDWLQQQWCQKPQQQGEVASEAMFANIKKKIEVEQTAIQSPGRILSNRRKTKNEYQKLKIFFRYAAIFVIAFGLSWVIQNMSTTDKDPVIADTYPQYNEILVPYGSKAKVMLPDSSSVWLNAGARLKYPANFTGSWREVFLQGEAFFDITKDSQHPFVVNSNGLNIKVLGTKFNLMANADDNIIETTLVEGTIELLGLKGVDKQSNMVLQSGQKLTLRKEKDQYLIHNIEEAGLSMPEATTEPVKIKAANLSENVNVELTTAWTENKLVFVKERFGDVKTKLERWYGLTIEVKDPEILDYHFTGTFEKQTFEQAMNALSKAASCNFKIDKNHVTVSK